MKPQHLSVAPPPPAAPTEPALIVTPRLIAPYVLGALRRAHREHSPCNLDALCEVLPVRRDDVRRTLSALDQAGLFDVLRGRLTLHGFAVALKVGVEDASGLRAQLRAHTKRVSSAPAARVSSLPPPPSQSPLRRVG